MKKPRKKVGLRWWIKTYRLALRRRLSLLLTGDFDPYPHPPDDVQLSPSLAHFADYRDAPLQLAWSRAGISDPVEWQRRTRLKLVELLGYENHSSAPVARHAKDFPLPRSLRRRRIYLRARDHLDIPINLVWREGGGSPKPVLLYMSGSTSGVHVAWGDALIPADYLLLGVGADMARQAAERGSLVVCIEQACFGERLERHLKPKSEARCVDAANHALLLGRSLLGEQVMDVSSVIDWLEAGQTGFDIDLTKLHLFGHSSGGTIAVYSAAVDLRITAAICSGCVGFIQNSGKRRNPEGASVVPGILKWMESDDIVALCAPRPFIAVSGTLDHIYPFEGVKAVVESARQIYRLFDAEGAICAVQGMAGHQYYPDVTWAAASKMLGTPARVD